MWTIWLVAHWFSPGYVAVGIVASLTGWGLTRLRFDHHPGRVSIGFPMHMFVIFTGLTGFLSIVWLNVVFVFLMGYVAGATSAMTFHVRRLKGRI